jgi:DNA-binding NtrC family response regulator
LFSSTSVFPKLKVLYKMKSENPAVRVVVSSGFLAPELRTKVQQAGVQHFIEKPYMLDQVVDVIQGLIEAA